MPSAKDIFLRALELATPDERREFVAKECAGDQGLQRVVEALLAAHDDPDSYLERPAARFDVSATVNGPGSGSGLSDSSSHHGRFLPGTKLAGRYRIVSLLGRGGMGEVYRADDLKLGQTVALKFLPPELAKDPKRLEYFHNEVRLARQVSHPNVCRVYDLGEVEGQQFISMEYIDGEDLKALLQRIGRLPKDKGIQIAQQLCAGLAVAHAKGVLHRDLKPANIMIDGQGHVRVTDFGLATATSDGEPIVGMSGTPAYMAPEQLLRGETSVQSDLYSLGLILYEVFTGTAAHQPNSLAELRQLHEASSKPSRPSKVVEDMDAAVEAAILRCLDPDPMERPASVQQLALSMPGADPLAAAMTAGETPRPELVATCKAADLWSPRMAWLVFIITIAGLAAFPFISRGVFLIHHVPMQESPDVLESKARQILVRLGVDDDPVGAARGFDHRWRQLRQRNRLVRAGLADHIEAAPDFPVMRFWYRRHAGHLVSDEFWSSEDGSSFARSQIARDHPAPIEPGMAEIELDTRGRLLRFHAVPESTKLELAEPVPSYDWESALDEPTLGFDLSTLSPCDWNQIPPAASDHIIAWSGKWPESERDLYVQAASLRGRPVYFEVLNEVEWNQRPRPSIQKQESALIGAIAFLGIALLIAALALAYSNYRNGRIDLENTLRIVAVVFVLNLTSWLLRADHVPIPWHELRLAFEGTSVAALMACLTGLLYFAIEPLARRFWPHLLVTWTRALYGRWRDPAVGQSILAGVAASVIVLGTGNFVARSFPASFAAAFPMSLMGTRELAEFLAGELSFMLSGSLGALLTLVVLRLALRLQILAGVSLTAIAAIIAHSQVGAPLELLPLFVVLESIVIMVFLRYGFLSLVAAWMTVPVLSFPYTNDWSCFYAERGVFLLFLLAALSTFGLYVTLGGRSRPNAVAV